MDILPSFLLTFIKVMSTQHADALVRILSGPLEPQGSYSEVLFRVAVHLLASRELKALHLNFPKA